MTRKARPIDWIREENIKSWLFCDVTQLGTFDEGFVVHTHRLIHLDTNREQELSVYSPLFAPYGFNGGVCVGAMYGGRSALSAQFPLGHKIMSKFAIDLRNHHISVLMTHMPEDSDFVELLHLEMNDAGDIHVRVAIFERSRPDAIHFMFQTLEKRDCAFCSIRGFTCDCSEKMRRSALPSLSMTLRDEFSAVNFSQDVHEARATLHKIMETAYSGTFSVEGKLAHGDNVRSLEPFQKKYTCRGNGDIVSAAKIRYVQNLVAEHRPRPLKIFSSYADNIILSNQEELVLEDVRSGDDSRSGDDLQSQRRPLALSAADKRVDGMFVCTQCDSRFLRKFDMRRHIRSVHFGERLFNCKQCSRRFIQKSHLREHVRSVHDKVMSASCPECGKEFSTKSKANRHVLSVHRNQRNFQCTICEHSFFQRWDFQKHLETHTGQRDLVSRAGATS